MFWYIIILICFICIAVGIWSVCDFNGWDIFRSSFWTIVLAGLFTVLGTAINVICSDFMNPNNYNRSNNVEVQEIVSFEDTKNGIGSYLIGTGGKNDQLYYYYYTDENLGYTLHKVNAEGKNVHVKYVDDKTQVLKYKLVPKSFWAWTFGCINTNDYVFQVPEGTINFNYKVDLK